MAIDDSIDFQLFRYTPNQAAAGLFAGLFLLTTLLHIYQLTKTRAWYCIPFIIGGIFQITGSTARIPAHTSKESIPIVSTQAILILLTPSLRRLNLQDPRPPDYLPRRRKAQPCPREMDDQDLCRGRYPRIPHAGCWRGDHVRWLSGLSVASILILVRSVFRLVEYVQGNDGYLISHEVFMYVFDSALMFLAMVVMNVWHPSMVLGGKGKERDDDISAVESVRGLREDS